VPRLLLHSAIAAALVLAAASRADAQWGPEVRLTEEGRCSATSLNNVWNVAVDGCTLHVVWYDERDGNSVGAGLASGVYFLKRSGSDLVRFIRTG
jgi:hypothetical protein